MKRRTKTLLAATGLMLVAAVCLADFAGDLRRHGIVGSSGGDVAIKGSLTVNQMEGVRLDCIRFFDYDVAANQTDQVWGMDPTANVGGANFVSTPAMQAGSIVGVAVFSNAACTSGTLTAWPTINGTPCVLYAQLDSVVGRTVDLNFQSTGVETFDAGDLIGIEVTTTATWAPTTADVSASLMIAY